MKEKTVCLLTAGFLLMAVFFTAHGYAQSASPADVNVNGVWESPDWGKVILNQPAGSRDITGEGDGWRVDGSVDGKKVRLTFSHKRTRRVMYTAELTAISDTKLEGRYSKGMLREDTKGKSMVLTRQAATPTTGI